MNKGRMSKDRISLPDIDIDVPPELRDKAIDYLKDKYGEPCVAQLPTFGKLKAKAVIKGVLRAHNACSPKEMDELTKHIPEDAKVSDELAETKQSLLDWSIDNVPELWNYVKRHDGELIGDYAEYFEQALRLEGTFQSIGKHAGGVIVCSEPIVDCCPMVMQSDGSEPIVGVEMNAAEKMGLVKIDVLGLEMLSKLMYINQMLMGEV
jgi:DNA polymerase-3 subunit alpha